MDEGGGVTSVEPEWMVNIQPQGPPRCATHSEILLQVTSPLCASVSPSVNQGWLLSCILSLTLEDLWVFEGDNVLWKWHHLSNLQIYHL